MKTVSLTMSRLDADGLLRLLEAIERMRLDSQPRPPELLAHLVSDLRIAIDAARAK